MRLPALFLALLAAPMASARTIPLNWVEQATTTYYPAAMNFKIRSITVTPRAWSVHASFANRSAKAVRIAKPADTYPPQYAFGLGWAPTCKPPAISCALETRTATYAKPALPKSLRPGQTWSGVFGGPGKPARGKLIYVTFGYFQAADRGFSWITTHAFKL